LITLAYYASYVIIFGSFEEGGEWDIFRKSLPLLIPLKLFAFLAAGVYRGLWRYTGISDIITFIKGIAFGSVLSVLAILLLWRFEGFSRTVFVLDGLLLLLAVFGSRMAFRMIREFLPGPHHHDGRRVLIYGAGDGGEMVLRELRNNSSLGYRPVGFVDDDPLKRDKVISGLRVHDGNGSLRTLCQELDVDEILISFRGSEKEKIEELRSLCRDMNISLKRAELRIDTVEV
jgi:UDP-GlcNAc:undecaprenyl-phosphate GlcNAc-1-phosphate transferase